MKKRRVTPSTYAAASKSTKKQPEEKNLPSPNALEEDDDEENSGFSKWMRTGEGVEFMKYFVVLNSLGVFLTLGWPSISKAFEIIKSFFVDTEDSY